MERDILVVLSRRALTQPELLDEIKEYYGQDGELLAKFLDNLSQIQEDGYIDGPSFTTVGGTYELTDKGRSVVAERRDWERTQLRT